MEYFEKEKVLKRLRCLCEIAAEPPMDDEDSKKLRMLQALEKEFESFPTADVAEVKHGKWKHTAEFGQIIKYHYWNCSLCGASSQDEGREHYCHCCGAKMNDKE